MSAKIQHEAVVELFRCDGLLLKELFGDRFDLAALEPKVETPELTQLPVPYRADSVTVFRDRGGVARFAMVVEVQHSRDDDKPFTWPVYLCATRAAHRCPTVLLVVTNDRAIAKKARASIETGHPGFLLTPLVITPGEIPLINDPEAARRAPRLAVLSGLTHPSLEAAAVALSVLDRVSPEYVEVYRDLIFSALSSADQEELMAMTEQYQFKSLPALLAIAAGKEEGRIEGRIEGRLEGRIFAQGIAVQLAKAKLGELSQEEEARIRELDSEERLQELILELGAASSPLEARQKLP